MDRFKRKVSPLRGVFGRSWWGRRSFSCKVEGLETRTLATAGLALHSGKAGQTVEHRSQSPLAEGVRAIKNIVYLNHGGRQEHLDLYLPTGPAPVGGRPVILALAGGGWRWVRRNDLGVTISTFTKEGYVVAVADYAFASSSAGSHVWPTNFEDVRQAVRWLKTNAGQFGIDPNRVAAWGESACGHLASLLGTYPDGPIA